MAPQLDSVWHWIMKASLRWIGTGFGYGWGVVVVPSGVLGSSCLSPAAPLRDLWAAFVIFVGNLSETFWGSHRASTPPKLVYLRQQGILKDRSLCPRYMYVTRKWSHPPHKNTIATHVKTVPGRLDMGNKSDNERICTRNGF